MEADGPETATNGAIGAADTDATQAEKDNDTDKVEDGEVNADVKSNQANDKGAFSRPRFEPPSSWNDQTLLDLMKGAGFLHFESPDEVPPLLQRRVRKSCFPPTEDEAARFQLEKCIRCLSHDNDTGGFFVALLKKVAPISRKDARRNNGDGISTADATVESQNESPEKKRVKPNPEPNDGETAQAGADVEKVIDDDGIDDDDEHPPEATRKRERVKINCLADEPGKKNAGLGRDDFIPPDASIFGPLTEFYGLSDSFPKDQIMTRACGDAKSLIYMSKSVKENFIDKGVQSRVTIINSGVKAFVRNTNLDSTTAPYRVSQVSCVLVLLLFGTLLVFIA